MFINDVLGAINCSRQLRFAYIHIYRTIKWREDWNLLQPGTDSVHGFYSVNFYKLAISKANIIFFWRITNLLIYEYELYQVSTTRTDSSKDLRVFLDSNLNFYQNVNYISFRMSVTICNETFYPNVCL
jgi:hypothetical protein